ncbi:MAG: tRNA nucleotidyltransferase (CCA-adding enzyme) [Gammaproteobacteria bacterium]|jgi:tRNA nucleotidyltransferase (CCA-adding enzyme)
MHIYKVGGCVRDGLLKREIKDRDWVVVGSSDAEMAALGYKKVGKDFPVYLHPQTHEEYALARTERKTGPGYYGFEVNSSASVTLEEDLSRRDLTINAIAEDEAGNLIDPYGGQRDLRAGILRHVSPAFVEDPLRVLRIARFAARFNFDIALETVRLMKEISSGGELLNLPAERVWVELDRALGEEHPHRFIDVLRQCNALAVLLPEIDGLFGIPQPAKYHPEIDTGEHVLLALRQAAARDASSEVRFAVLVHDLGKATSDPDHLPGHVGHEERGVVLVEDVCERFKVPKAHRLIALAVTRYHLMVHRAQELRPQKLLKLLTNLDAMRRPERFSEILLACEIDATGRLGMADSPYPSAEYMREARQVANDVDVRQYVEQGLGGEQLREKIDQVRVRALADARGI